MQLIMGNGGNLILRPWYDLIQNRIKLFYTSFNIPLEYFVTVNDWRTGELYTKRLTFDRTSTNVFFFLGILFVKYTISRGSHECRSHAVETLPLLPT